MLAHRFEHPRFNLFEHVPRRDQTKVDFVRTRAIANLNIAAQTKLHTDQFLDRAFSQSDDVIVAALLVVEVSANASKQRSNAALEHRLQFARRARQQKEMRRGERGSQNRRYVESRGGAMSVRKHRCALGNHGLAKHALAQENFPAV